MEKYGQYRDKGSGIAPFFPVPSQSGGPLYFPWHVFLFCIRIPLVTFAWFIWFTIVQWMPAPNIVRKANLWCVLGIPGVWWIDIQVDGVRRGSLAQTPRARLPSPGQIIACSYTSPLDILYLAAIFDPIFTQSSTKSRLVRPVSLELALAQCCGIALPTSFAASKQGAIPLSQLTQQNRSRVIVVFPEATTSNGRGILKFSPSLLSAKPDTKIFPISLRYTPADIVTPIPGWLEAARFIWRLNGRPTHCIRVRIGAPATLKAPPNTAEPGEKPTQYPSGERSTGTGYESNFFDSLDSLQALRTAGDPSDEGEVSESEQQVLDAVADTLARLGRVKRVGLGVEEKKQFVEAWFKRKGYR